MGGLMMWSVTPLPGEDANERAIAAFSVAFYF
jgi:hypothetical protein